MRGADREYDEDDEAGAEESHPGYAQDSHALEREADLCWYWGYTTGKVMQGEKGERYQFTALLWKLAHQDLIGCGICHASRVQRHLRLQGKAQAATKVSSSMLMLMLMLMLISSSSSGLISTSPDSVSSPLMYCRMLLSHQNLLIAKILHKIEEKMRNVILCKYDTFCHNNLALTLWAAHSHKSRFASAGFFFSAIWSGSYELNIKTELPFQKPTRLWKSTEKKYFIRLVWQGTKTSF